MLAIKSRNDPVFICLHRPGQVEEDAVVIEAEVGEVVREVGEVVAEADLQVVAEIARDLIANIVSVNPPLSLTS